MVRFGPAGQIRRVSCIRLLGKRIAGNAQLVSHASSDALCGAGRLQNSPLATTQPIV